MNTWRPYGDAGRLLHSAKNEGFNFQTNKYSIEEDEVSASFFNVKNS
jgi:hypothetical protein